MRFLLPATGIIVLIATGYAIQFHLSSNHAAEVETKLGVSVPSCRQTGHEDAAGVRGTSSIAGAVADWSDKITAESPVGAGREGCGFRSGSTRASGGASKVGGASGSIQLISKPSCTARRIKMPTRRHVPALRCCK